MLDCLIIGDGIAAGLAPYMHECASYARMGSTSKMWLEKFGSYPALTGKTYKVVVISISKDDYYNTASEEHLYDIRIRLNADLVIWLMPSPILKPKQHALITKIALWFNDRTISFQDIGNQEQMSSDKYATLADKIRSARIKPLNGR